MVNRLYPKHGCVVCNQLFSDTNVFTDLGYKEIFLSGMCEACFDRLFQDEEEPKEPTTPEPDAWDIER